MSTQYTVTYDIVTPESAQDGDVAERGFIDTQDERIECPDLTGPAFVMWAAAQDIYHDAPDWLGAPDCEPAAVWAEEIRSRIGMLEHRSGHSFYGVPDGEDFATASEITVCVHMPRDTDETLLAAIEARLRS